MTPQIDRPNKRARVLAGSEGKPTKPRSTARLFAPFRALGFISNDVPFALQVRSAKGALKGPNVNIVSCLGKSWAMWDAGKMNLLFVGPEEEEDIASLAVHNNDLFASAGSKVIRYQRGKQVAAYSASTPDVKLGQILIFGEQLLALRQDGKGLLVWKISTLELESEIKFHGSFNATTMLHPATYMNKVIVGSVEGALQIWNVRTMSLIHTFPPPKNTSAAVTTVAQSPAIDVIGVGHADGRVRVVDIKIGEEIFDVKMEEGGIAGLSFRMDGPPILATSSTSGCIAVWDLGTKGRILHVLRDAHEAPVNGLQWVQGQPLLISSSGDNSIKQWVFDADTALPRLLKFRTGHHAPVSCIRYYGEDGKQILSAGRDRALRYTSVVRDSRSHELSQGSLAKKASNLSVSVTSLKFQPVLAISSSSTRSKDWEDVVTAHVNDSYARTWRVQDKKAGRWALDVQDGAVKTVCVTACGNYAVAGSSTGQIRCWNLQSGHERKVFNLAGVSQPTQKSRNLARSKAVRVGKSVTGLATDALNSILVASTLDGTLNFFDFHTTQLEHTITLPSNVTQINLNRDSGLLAVVCDDLVVRLIDIETRRIVRELAGFKGRVLDLTFSPDSRWLVAASLDSIVRTFDVPTGQLVDAFRTSSISTSVTFSPTGDFLATAQVDSVGVYLWANKAQFSEVALRHIDEDDITNVSMPSVHGTDDDADLEGITPVGEPEYQDIYTTPDQIAEEMMTLSLVPRSKWQTLLNLDTIRMRNKPKEAPKAPEQAPFFLPTVTNLDDGFGTRFDIPTKGDGEQNTGRRTGMDSAFVESDFTARLSKEDPNGGYNAFFEYVKALSPAKIDLEIRSLLTLEHLEKFLRSLIARLKTHRDFEVVQALLNVCLTIHSDLLMENSELRATLEDLLAEQKKESGRLMNLISYSLGTISFLRSGA
ncbi:hypothetical protein QFC22_005366 [Naganishia vaughanmartiniae]|uniref:Uncharacterized protein n=1 Tax=Naganishia vaughanmartiniae TaxID=1424756 RepID=A0ACC2WUC1_9TREE|nr:hypothetical protein QFC22_005366 [Naganishia vaughanmartiniae]